jgi:N-acetylglucosaminyl-diphospho-decaprenol L-rhamnosyltransferase
LRTALAGSEVTIVARPDNPGYGGGINAGVAVLGDAVEWILVVNPDVVLRSGSIDALIDAATTDDRIGSLGPRIVDDFGDTYPSARAIPSLTVGVGHALLGDIVPANPWTRDYHRQSDYEVQRDAGWLSGACVLVRRSAFDSVGGFDDDFFMYFEDVDLGYRLGRHGWRNVFVPTSVVEHEGGHSTKGNSVAMIAAHHASARLWVAKRYPGALRSPVRVAITLGLRVRQSLVSRR